MGIFNDDYKTTIPEYYVQTCVDYGQVIQIRVSGKVVDKKNNRIWKPKHRRN